MDPLTLIDLLQVGEMLITNLEFVAEAYVTGDIIRAFRSDECPPNPRLAILAVPRESTTFYQ